MSKSESHKYAIVVVDMINDFFYGALKFDRAASVVDPVTHLLEKARAKEVPIIFTCDAHYKGIDHEFGLWGEHGLRGTEGIYPIAPLRYNPEEDYMVYKTRYSAFFRTDLDVLLSELGVDTIILVGVHTHICVEHTAADAYYLGFNIIASSDGTTAFTKEDHERALKKMHDLYGASLAKCEEIIKLL
ncbi:MAG: cysteine hydrolase [Coprobacillus sp.]|nr:cysteine hydrolase [Coprobacillus sp.]